MKCNTSANYFPDGHGKEKIDGHIGRVGRWIREIAKKRVLNTHAGLTEALQEVAVVHNSEHIGRSQCNFVHFNPPPVKALPGAKMSPAELATNGCAVKSTFAMRAGFSSGGQLYLQNHTLTGLPFKARTVPRYDSGKPKPAVAEEDADEDVPVADGEVGKDGWRRTYRKNRPEKAPPGWKYMAQCYRIQWRTEVALVGRRRPVAARRAEKLRSIAAEKARRKHAREVAARKLEKIKADRQAPQALAAEESSDSSSGSSITGTSSSDSDSSG